MHNKHQIAENVIKYEVIIVVYFDLPIMKFETCYAPVVFKTSQHFENQLKLRNILFWFNTITSYQLLPI